MSDNAGATIARHGYYISIPCKTLDKLTVNEWNCWYVGVAVNANICGPVGRIIAKVGSHRDAGSNEERMSNIAFWSTMMDEHNYLVRCWNEILAA